MPVRLACHSAAKARRTTPNIDSRMTFFTMPPLFPSVTAALGPREGAGRRLVTRIPRDRGSARLPAARERRARRGEDDRFRDIQEVVERRRVVPDEDLPLDPVRAGPGAAGIPREPQVPDPVPFSAQPVGDELPRD